MKKIYYIIIPILVLALILKFSIVDAATFGYTSLGASSASIGTNSFNNPVAILATLPVNGSLTSITAGIYHNPTSGTAFCRIYSGSAGSRGSLLGTTNSATTVNTSAGFQTFTFASPVALTAGTYWLQCDGGGGGGPGSGSRFLVYDGGGGANTGYMLNDVGVPQYDANQYSIYGTYTADSVAVEIATSTVHINNGSIKISNGSVIQR